MVKFLTSEGGKKLNGRVCECTGHDGERLTVRMRDDGSIFKLKMCNLLHMEAGGPTYVVPSGHLIPDDEIVRRLKNVLAQVHMFRV